MNLKDIIKEIEKMGKKYRSSDSDGEREDYNQYVELIITNDAEISQQYNLCNYWSRLTR